MITKSVFEQEIISNFQQELKKQASPKALEVPDLVKAAECLHAALEIFEHAGLSKQANQMLRLLAKIANKPVEPRSALSKKKPNMSDEMGFVFDMDEADAGSFEIDLDEAFDKDIPFSDFEDEKD